MAFHRPLGPEVWRKVKLWSSTYTLDLILDVGLENLEIMVKIQLRVAAICHCRAAIQPFFRVFAARTTVFNMETIRFRVAIRDFSRHLVLKKSF
ncbi:hypothetical protein ACSBLW_01050 [Thioclava sp. FR2]|uniref:hypothetical protein n=1 Tax=Thioclava sp. FR2 TaxID=3445780 RepID=UPI003EB822D0